MKKEKNNEYPRLMQTVIYSHYAANTVDDINAAQAGGNLPAEIETEVPALYYCSVVVPKLFGFKKFPVSLYYGGHYEKKRGNLPYNKLIVDYDPLDEEANIYSENAINELLLYEEVMELKVFLAKYYKLKLSYSKVVLPIMNNSMACTDLPTDSRRGFFCLQDRLSKDDPHDLSFSVICWYDKLIYMLNHPILKKKLLPGHKQMSLDLYDNGDVPF